MSFKSEFELPIHINWNEGISQKYLIKEILTSPYVINYINVSNLTNDWKDFTHALHLDIYQNFELYYNHVKTYYNITGQMRITYIWCFILEEMGLFTYYLPDELLNLLYFHL